MVAFLSIVADRTNMHPFMATIYPFYIGMKMHGVTKHVISNWFHERDNKFSVLSGLTSHQN